MPLSMKEKQSVANMQRDEYRNASKKQKEHLLDEFCKLTGFNRNYGARKLRSSNRSASHRFAQRGKSLQKPQGRKRLYGPECLEPLTTVWAVMDLACGKRIAAGMADMLGALSRSGELSLEKSLEDKLRSMSASTIDRLLKEQKRRMCSKGRATTKPGSLLKSQIPIRTGTEWNEQRPGFVEMDTVAHCGETTRGQYVVTLDVTDIHTCWTEQRAAFNKAAKHVYNEFQVIRARVPFPIHGVDCDSGAEFINDLMFRYCRDENIHFTRGRPYRKNDGCHVEQKNWSIVRQTVGYGRFETYRECELLNEIYDRLRLLTNFFMPSQKLTAKTRGGGRIIRKLDTPLTPYRRVLASELVGEDKKILLREIFANLNPAALRRDMTRLISALRTYKTLSQSRQGRKDDDAPAPQLV